MSAPPERFPDAVPDTGATSRGVAVLAGGCFWCVEAVYRQIDGVTGVVSGYTGGTADTADYETVCGGGTGHAEAVEVRFDPTRTTYGALLRVFFSIAHDPTQLNRQGDDRGRQYRSAIFHVDDEQRRVAEAYIRLLEEEHLFDAPIVTELRPLDAFHTAETYHQDYARRNPDSPYIQVVAEPKVRKARAHAAKRPGRAS